MATQSPRLLRFLALLVMLLISPCVFAQGSEKDYNRSQSLYNRWQNKVLNVNLHDVWVDAHHLLYRKQLDQSHWQFMVVDARSSTKQRAFDHTMVAETLTTILGRPIQADALPFNRFAKVNNAIVTLVEKELRVFELRLNGNVHEIPLEQAAPFFVQRSDHRRSRDAGGECNTVFINQLSVPVEMVWLDRNGGQRTYVTIKSGDRHTQHTFAGHAWVARTKEDDPREFGTFVAPIGGGIAIINDESNRRAATGGPKNRDREGARRRNVSPDGKWIAFVRDHNVFIRLAGDQGQSAEHALSTDGHVGDTYLGHFEWSADSTRLLAVQEIPAETHEVQFVESSPSDQKQPKLHSMNYLKPGDRIAHPRPRLFDVENKIEIAVDDSLFPTPWSRPSFAWNVDGQTVTFLYNQRGHRVMRLIELNVQTGATRVVINDEPDTFFDYANKQFHQLIQPTREVIWMSERSGYNHLYLYDYESSEVKHAITTGEWVVRRIDRVDEANREIWFTALGVYPDQDPYYEHKGRVNFDGSDLVWLTEGDGTHQIEYAPQSNGTYYIDTYSRVDLPPVHELRRTEDGSLIVALEASDATELYRDGWTPPERFVAKGRDGKTDIHGLIIYPSDFDPAKRYPVIENIYAGPHGYFVPKAFSHWHGSREMAELGFIVVRIDGMGTNWRSKAFHDVAWKNLSDSGFPDRIKWIEAAAKERPFMDLTRVGIYGGSAGGQSALRAMLGHGEFYHAAVADCGCHDNLMDKIWWNELWMSWPIDSHYEEQSNVTQAHNLQGDLLLVVGELDRNVDPASTMQVVDALIKADKDFELLVMPGVGHGATGTPYGKRRLKDFFVRKLLHVEPRWKE